jgi:hypothetical protein
MPPWQRTPQLQVHRRFRLLTYVLCGRSARCWTVSLPAGPLRAVSAWHCKGFRFPSMTSISRQDIEGAYAIERRLGEHIVHPVRWVESDRLRSHLGTFTDLGIKVEVIGDIEKLGKDGKWEAPPDLAAESLAMRVGDMTFLVMSLAHEAAAYDKVGRHERAALLRQWLDRDVPNEG